MEEWCRVVIRIKDRNAWLALEYDEVRSNWKDYFELHSKSEAFMMFREVSTSEENRLGYLK